MSGIGAAVLVAFLFVLPILLGVLGVTAFGHDKMMAWILFCVVLTFASVMGVVKSTILFPSKYMDLTSTRT